MNRLSLTRFLSLFLILTLPVLFFQNWQPGYTAPGARSGDEPHYLVILFSLVKDGDLKTANNYQSGDLAQGRYLSERTLDRHAVLVNHNTGVSYEWSEIFSVKAEAVSERLKIERRREMAHLDLSGFTEYGFHPPGYPALLTPLLFWFVKSDFTAYETIIALLQLLLYAFAWLRVGSTMPAKFWQLALAATALPAWYYSASFYTEGVAAALTLLSVAAYRLRRPLELSLYLGLLFFIKESHAPLAPIFALFYYLKSRNKKDVIKIALFPTIAFLLFMARSYVIYGEPLRTYLPWQSNPHFFTALFELCFSGRDGILTGTPILLFSFLAVAALIYKPDSDSAHKEQSDRTGWLLLISFLYYYLLTAGSIHWSGGPSFGARLLVPALTLLAPALLYLFAYKPSTVKRYYPLNLLYTTAFYGLFMISIINSFFGVTNLRYAYSAPFYINLFEPGDSGLWRRIKK